MKSFFRYVQAQAPEQIAQARHVLGVKAAQVPQPAIGYLPVDAISLLLTHATRRGLRDLALVTTLYDTGARVQEVCDLSIGDLHLDKPASATLTGKGRKTRIVPLTPQAAQILTQHVRTLSHDPSGPVFANRDGQRLGRAGAAYILTRCANTAHAEQPDLVLDRSRFGGGWGIFRGFLSKGGTDDGIDTEGVHRGVQGLGGRVRDQ